MGRQFSFYMLPSDANTLVEQLRTQLDVKLLLDYSPEYETLEIDLPYRSGDNETLEPMNANARYYLAPPFGNIERRYCAKPNWWVIETESEGIEFSGCKFNGTAVAIGRFWYETNIVRDLQYVPKSKEFLKWAEAVYRLTKRSLHYEPGIYAYLSENAMNLRKTGGQFARDIWPNGKVIPA